MTRDLTELDELEKYLKEHGYEYDRTDDDGKIMPSPFGPILLTYEHHQIIVYENGERSWDVILNSGSYGAEKGLLEAMGARVVRSGDSVEGYLTADEIIERLEAGQ